MGYAPADDPQIAIYVVVDRANASPQDDAKFATGIVRNVLTEVLPYLNIFMTEELSEKEIQELAEKQIEITNQYTQSPRTVKIRITVTEPVMDRPETIRRAVEMEPATLRAVIIQRLPRIGEIIRWIRPPVIW